MDSLDDLKTIWRTANTDQLPAAAEIVQLVKKFRRKKLRGQVALVSGAVVAIGLLVWVMCSFSFLLLTTYAGGILMIVACAMLVAATLKSIKRFRHLQDDCSNREFLSFIEITRGNQLHFYRHTQVIMMAVWACGFLLYFYEFVSMRPTVMIAVYSICILYILLLFFVIRPYSYKKEAKKLQATKERLELILNQLK